MSSHRWFRPVLFLVVAVAASVLFTAPARAGDCVSVDATLTGWIDLAGPEGPTWYGVAYFTFGKDPNIVVATFVDKNNGYKEHPAKANFAGFELTTFRVEGVGTFLTDARFNAVAYSPTLYELNETSQLVPSAGTGAYEGVTGNLVIKGPFAGGDCTPAMPCLWIGRGSGSFCKPN